MEYWPSLSPRSFSSRLPGGARRSSMFVAALSTRSFDNALSLNSVGTAFDLRPRKSLSVSLSAKLFITSVYYRGSLIVSSTNEGRRHIRRTAYLAHLLTSRGFG